MESDLKLKNSAATIEQTDHPNHENQETTQELWLQPEEDGLVHPILKFRYRAPAKGTLLLRIRTLGEV
jgi:hypothetical protein